MPVLLLLLAVLALTGCADSRTAGGPDAGHPVVEGAFVVQDLAAEDAEFVAFRKVLRDIVARRDTAALTGLVADGARLSFGDEPGGAAGVRQMWLSGSPPGDETLWEVLGRILGAGSVYEDGAVTVPFVYGAWPDTVDAFTHVAIVRERAPARAEPAASADTVALVTHALLPVLAPPLSGFWQLRLPGGQTAFVSTADAMSPVGYRAAFWDAGEGWKLHLLVAGD